MKGKLSLLVIAIVCLSSLVFSACESDKPHEYKYNAVITQPTCEAQGFTTHACDCGESYVDAYVDAVGHDYGEWISNSDGAHTKTCKNDNTHTVTENCYGGSATCTEKAVCEVCKGEYGTTGEHSYSVEWSYDGSGHWHECSCGDKKDEGSHIPSAVATESDDQVCTVCRYVITPALGHVHIDHLTKVKSEESTCTDEGNIEYYICSCGMWFTDDAAVTEITDKTAVATAKKSHSFTCQNLGQEYLRSAATCTDKAVYFYSCVCGEKGTETFVYGDELGHDYGEWKESTAATCTSEGVDIRVCKHDATHIETRLTEKKQHSYASVVTPPTCTTKGYTTYTCICGDSYIENYVDATGIHNYINNYCADCGRQKVSEGLAYYINSDGLTCKITGIGDCTDTELFIPSAIGDYTVVEISSSAFRNCINLTAVTIPDSVTSIGSGAFNGCSSLREITVPFVGASKSVTGAQAVFGYIFGYTTKSSYEPVSGAIYQYEWLDGTSRKYNYYYIPISLLKVTVTGGDVFDYAFNNCEGLTSVTIGSGVTSIGHAAFKNCSRLTNFVIPDSVAAIGSSAFYGCSGLTSITIPDSVTSIESYVFAQCDGLTSIEIGRGVASINAEAFVKSSKLTNITVNAENETYCVVNNCLIEKTTKTLIWGCDNSVIPDDRSITSIGGYAFEGCASLTNVVIPNSVTLIGSGAFANCTGLTNVTLGNSVTEIKSSAFSGCTSLTSITIPASVTWIGSYTFYNCTSLKSIEFKDRFRWYNKTSDYSGYEGSPTEMSSKGSENVSFFVNNCKYNWYKK